MFDVVWTLKKNNYDLLTPFIMFLTPVYYATDNMIVY